MTAAVDAAKARQVREALGDFLATQPRTITTHGGRTFTICRQCQHWVGRTEPGRVLREEGSRRVSARGQCVDGCRCEDPCHSATGDEVQATHLAEDDGTTGDEAL